MTYKDFDGPNWRNEVGLESRTFYKRKWAFKPITCSDGTILWFKSYYSQYRKWSSNLFEVEDEYGHIDFVENITEAEYIVRKLADNL